MEARKKARISIVIITVVRAKGGRGKMRERHLERARQRKSSV